MRLPKNDNHPPLQSWANQLPEEDPPRQGRWTHSWFQICTSNQKRLNGKKGKTWEFSPQISFDWQTARGGNGQIRPKFPKWELGVGAKWEKSSTITWVEEPSCQSLVLEEAVQEDHHHLLRHLLLGHPLHFRLRPISPQIHPGASLPRFSLHWNVLHVHKNLLTQFCSIDACGHLYRRRNDSWMEGYKSYLKSKKVELKDKPIQNSLEKAVSRVWGCII